MRLFTCAALLILGVTSSAPSRAGIRSAQDLPSFIADVQQDLRHGKVADIAARALNPRDFAWLSSLSAQDLPGWSLAAVNLPGRQDPQCVAIFRSFHTLESTGDHIYTLVLQHGRWRFGREIPEADTLGYRIRNHNLVVTFDLPNSTCRITDDVRVERSDAAAAICILRLSCDMVVDKVTVDGEDAAAQAVPGMVVLSWHNKAQVIVHLEYHGKVDHPGSDYIRADEVLLCSYWYPHIARLPATQTTTATVPKGWTVVAEGELINRTEKRHSTTFTFTNRIPTCFFTLDAGEYSITSRTVNGRRLSVYELDRKPGRAQKALDLLQQSLAFFEAAFGPFPYTHYELVETRGPFDGALEAYSFSTYDRGDFGALVHELSHTWWGGIVPNPYTQTLWNESFASYSDDLFRRLTGKESGGNALTGAHSGQDHGRDMLKAFPIPISQAYDTMDQTQAAVGYGKGAMVLKMLEDELTTPVMMRCLRRFVREHPAGEAGSWEEFQRAVQNETGKDYAWFFRQWIYRAGVPVLAAAAGAVRRESAGYVVELHLRQEGEPYRLRIPVLIRGADGSSARRMIAVQGAAASVRLELPFRPKSVTLDPDGNVLMASDRAGTPEKDPLTLELSEDAAAHPAWSLGLTLPDLVVQKG
ncbi:MAG: M1 family metallopeptidase [Chthonomonadales bacterium]